MLIFFCDPDAQIFWCIVFFCLSLQCVIFAQLHLFAGQQAVHLAAQGQGSEAVHRRGEGQEAWRQGLDSSFLTCADILHVGNKN